MSSNNNNSEMMGFALMVAVVGLAAFFIFALLAFVAFLMTILCVFAWSRPVTIFGATLMPHEARSFVGWGIIGVGLLPGFAMFCEVLFGLHFSPNLWGYLVIGGYSLGSVGYAAHMAEQEDEPGEAVTLPEIAPPSGPDVLPPPRRAPRAGEFARWDDEEELS